MPMVFPQQGPGFPQSKINTDPALDALRQLGSFSGYGSGSTGAPNPNRLTESAAWGVPGTEAGPITQGAQGQYSPPGWGGNLSPTMSSAGSTREGGWGNRNPVSGIPPVEQAGNEGVLQSLRMSFPPRKFNPPTQTKTDA